jgi:hypothetical protein
LKEIRICLLEVFQIWGLPLSIRTDNGDPFGAPKRDVIPMLSLWLLAWGIRPIHNHPRSPKENAKVERNQGTAGRWAEVYQCTDSTQMQLKLDEICNIQRDFYPVKRLGNVSRSAVFTGLNETPRPFNQAVFDEKKAYEYLAKVVYPRKVSSGGTISLYDQHFQVGLKHRGKIVAVKFQPHTVSWLAVDHSNGELLKVIPDPRFTKDNLLNLTICQ